ncbi:MAG: hypothetical protein R3284_07335 [Rubricoccaceae bacterium]|nr:hypothetical protein [Rubricoccaceae bacterium]
MRCPYVFLRVFDDGDFLVREAIEFVHEGVDLFVGGGDPALQGGSSGSSND